MSDHDNYASRSRSSVRERPRLGSAGSSQPQTQSSSSAQNRMQSYSTPVGSPPSTSKQFGYDEHGRRFSVQLNKPTKLPSPPNLASLYRRAQEELYMAKRNGVEVVDGQPPSSGKGKQKTPSRSPRDNGSTLRGDPYSTLSNSAKRNSRRSTGEKAGAQRERDSPEKFTSPE